MNNLTKQFFGDAKRLQLTSTEKSAVWSAIATRAASKTIALSSIEKAGTFAHIAQHMRNHPIHGIKRSVLGNFFAFHKLAASVMIAVLILGAGGGTVAYAAEGAMPDDVLYPVKLHFNEPLIEALQRSPEQRAAWEAKRIERRLREAEHIAQHEELIPEHQEHMRQRIEERIEHLNTVLESVPEEHKEKITEKIDAELDRHETFLTKVEEGTVTKKDVREFRKGMGELHDKFRSKHGKGPGKPPPLPQKPLQLPVEGWLSGRKRTTRNRVGEQSSRGFESPSLRQEQEPKDLIKQQNKGRGKENDKGIPGLLRKEASGRQGNEHRR